MRVARAVFAGLAGALAMSVAAIVAFEAGIEISFEEYLGALVGFDAGTPANITAGFLFHLMLGGWFAVIYVEGFERVVGHGGWSVGAFFAGGHAITAGFAVAFLPMLAPGISQDYVAPVAFMAEQGLGGVCVFILMHLLYGAIVGAIYAFTGTLETIHMPKVGPSETPGR